MSPLGCIWRRLSNNVVMFLYSYNYPMRNYVHISAFTIPENRYFNAIGNSMMPGFLHLIPKSGYITTDN